MNAQNVIGTPLFMAGVFQWAQFCNVHAYGSYFFPFGFDWFMKTEANKKWSKRCQKVVKKLSRTNKRVCASSNTTMQITLFTITVTSPWDALTNLSFLPSVHKISIILLSFASSNLAIPPSPQKTMLSFTEHSFTHVKQHCIGGKV